MTRVLRYNNQNNNEFYKIIHFVNSFFLIVTFFYYKLRTDLLGYRGGGVKCVIVRYLGI